MVNLLILRTISFKSGFVFLLKNNGKLAESFEKKCWLLKKIINLTSHNFCNI